MSFAQRLARKTNEAHESIVEEFKRACEEESAKGGTKIYHRRQLPDNCDSNWMQQNISKALQGFGFCSLNVVVEQQWCDRIWGRWLQVSASWLDSCDVDQRHQAAPANGGHAENCASSGNHIAGLGFKKRDLRHITVWVSL